MPTSTPARRWSSSRRSWARSHVERLVAELGEQRVSLIAIPGTPPLRRLEELGVARVSFGPLSQNVALTALAELTEGAVQRGEGTPGNLRILN